MLISRCLVATFLFVILFGQSTLSAQENFEYIIRWGLILPLSGQVAATGIDLQRGYELALADLSNQRVKHLLFIEDSQHDLRKAVDAAQKLIHEDKVDLLVSVWDTAEAIAPIAEKNNLLHAAIRWNSNIAETFSNTFTFESTYKTYALKFLELFRKQGIKKLSIIGQEATGWNLAEQEIIRHAPKYGVQVVSHQRYLNNESSYNLIALKAIQKQPDIVLINDISESAELFTKKIKVLRPKQRVTSYLGYPVDYSLFEGEYYINQLNLNKSFADRFEKTFKQPVYTRAQLAYDQMRLIGDLYEKFSIKPTTEQVVAELKKVTSYQGMSGLITNPTGKVFETECVTRKIENGKDVLALPE